MLKLNFLPFVEKNLLLEKRFVFKFEAPGETLKVEKQKFDFVKDGRERLESLGNQIKSVEDWLNKINEIGGFEPVKIPLSSDAYDGMLKNPQNPLARFGESFTNALRGLIAQYAELNALVVQAQGTKDQLHTSLNQQIGAINEAIKTAEETSGKVVKSVFSEGDPFTINTLDLAELSSIDPYRAANATEQMVLERRAAKAEETEDRNLLDQALGRALGPRSTEKLPPDKAFNALLTNIVDSPGSEGQQELVVDAASMLGGVNARALKEYCADPHHAQKLKISGAQGREVEVTALVGNKREGGKDVPSVLMLELKKQVGQTQYVTVVLPGSLISYVDNGRVALDQKRMANIRLEPLRSEPEKEPGMSLDEGIAQLAAMDAGSRMIVSTPDGKGVGITVSTDQGGGLPTFSARPLSSAVEIAQFRASGIDDEEARKVAIADAAGGKPDTPVDIARGTAVARDTAEPKGSPKAKIAHKDTPAVQEPNLSLLDTSSSLLQARLSSSLHDALKNVPVTVELIAATESDPGYIAGIHRNIQKLANDMVGYAALDTIADRTPEIRQILTQMAGNIARAGGPGEAITKILEIGKNARNPIRYSFEDKMLVCTIGSKRFEVPLTKEDVVITPKPEPEKKAEGPKFRTDFKVPETDEGRMDRIREIVKTKPDEIKRSLLELAGLIHVVGPNKAVRLALGSTDGGKTMAGSPFQITGGPGDAIYLGYGGEKVTIFEPGEIEAANKYFEKWFGDKTSEKTESRSPEVDVLADVANKIKAVTNAGPGNLDAALTELAKAIKTNGPNKKARELLGVNDKGESIGDSKFKLIHGPQWAISLSYKGIEKTIFAPGEISALTGLPSPDSENPSS